MKCPATTKSVIEFFDFDMSDDYEYYFDVHDENEPDKPLVELNKKHYPGQRLFVTKKTNLTIRFQASWNQKNRGFSFHLSCRVVEDDYSATDAMIIKRVNKCTTTLCKDLMEYKVLECPNTDTTNIRGYTIDNLCDPCGESSSEDEEGKYCEVGCFNKMLSPMGQLVLSHTNQR